MRRQFLPLILAAALLPAVARAQAPADTAVALFNRAQEHAKQGDYHAACPLYAESLRVDPQAGTLLNLADCEEHVGALAPALAHWREAIDKLGGPGSEKFLAFARKRAEDLDPRVPRLTVRLAPGAPAGTRVMRDGVELSTAALGVPMAVSPGAVELLVIAPGRRERRTTAQLAENDRLEVTVDPGAETALPVPVAPPVPPAPEPSWPRKHRASLAVMGFAAGGAAVAGALGAVTKADYFALQKTCAAPRCTDAQYARLHREAAATNGLLIASGALAVAAVVVFAVEARAQPASITVAVDGAGASAALRF